MKIRYTNFKKEFPSVREGRCIFSKWFEFKRYWNGKLIYISVKHHQLTIDMRTTESLIKDLKG